jgi:hypothetical protein
MAHFAKLGVGNIVETIVVVNNSVITDSNGVEQEQLGVDFLNQLYNTRDVWKKTSFNTNAGVHSLGGTPFRKNYAGIGYIYDEQRDAFIPPKRYESWILDETTCTFESPVTFPIITNFIENEITKWYFINWSELYLRWQAKKTIVGPDILYWDSNNLIWVDI